MRVVEGGLPHSEILGSKLVRSSPRLIAAYHVLLRLSAPRHPPNALMALDRSHEQCSPFPSGDEKSGPPLGAAHGIAPAGPSNALLEKTSLLRPCPASVRSGNGAGSAILSRDWIERPDMVPLHDVKDLACFRRTRQNQEARFSYPDECWAKPFDAQRLVEPDGIEPTTSCLQSTRSPN